MEYHKGIDILKIVIVYFVVVLFILNGGLLMNVLPGTFNYYGINILNIVSLIMVNALGLIMGYLKINQKFQLKKIINLWLYTVFISLIVVLVCSLFKPLDLKKYIGVFLPIVSNNYWYLNIFFALSFLGPFINRFMLYLDQKQLKRFLLAVFLLLSVFPMFAFDDLFNTNGGYSLIWFSFLYMMGSYIKLYGLEIKNKVF